MMGKEKGQWRRWGRWSAIALVGLTAALSVSCCAYRHAAASRLAKEVAETPRDTRTGILLGAEPLELGSGKRGVLMLHGFIGSPKDYGELPAMLAARGYRVRVPLLPGNGTRPQDLIPVSNDDLMAAVEKEYLTLRAECDEVSVIGFSMGGTLATLLATQGRVPPPERLVLVCPYYRVAYRPYVILSPGTWHRIMSPAFPYLIKGTAFVQVRRREAVPSIVSYHVVPREAITNLMDLARMVIDDLESRPPAQTLVVYSSHDKAASPSAIAEMADRWGIPPERRTVLANTNHHAFWDYEREDACARIVKFLEAPAN